MGKMNIKQKEDMGLLSELLEKFKGSIIDTFKRSPLIITTLRIYDPEVFDYQKRLNDKSLMSVWVKEGKQYRFVEVYTLEEN